MNVDAVTEYAGKAQSLFNDAITEAKEYGDRIVALRKDINRHEEELAVAQKAWQEDKELLIAEKTQIEAFITPLRAELQRLNTEISGSVTIKANLKLECARLAEENAKVKAYEVQAWKVLTAKENELLEREKAIEQKEVLKPRSKSLLPPIQ